MQKRFEELTPEEEIARCLEDFPNWHQHKQKPEIQKAITEKNVVVLGELLSRETYGNREPRLEKLPAYAREGAQRIIANGTQSKWKQVFKEWGFCSGILIRATRRMIL